MLSKIVHPWHPIWQKTAFLACLLQRLSTEHSDFNVTVVKYRFSDLAPEIGSLKKIFRFPELEIFF